MSRPDRPPSSSGTGPTSEPGTAASTTGPARTISHRWRWRPRWMWMLTLAVAVIQLANAALRLAAGEIGWGVATLLLAGLFGWISWEHWSSGVVADARGVHDRGSPPYKPKGRLPAIDVPWDEVAQIHVPEGRRDVRLVTHDGTEHHLQGLRGPDLTRLRAIWRAYAD